MNIIFSAQSLAIKPFFDVASKITSKDNIGILLSDHKYSLNLLKEKRIMQKNFYGDWNLSRNFNYKKSIDIIKNVNTGVIQSQKDWHCLLNEINNNLEENTTSFLTREIM